MTKDIEDLAAKGRRIRAEVAARAEQVVTDEAMRKFAKVEAEDRKRLWSVSLFGMRGREVGEFYFVLLAMAGVGFGIGWLFSMFHLSWGNLWLDAKTPLAIAAIVAPTLVLAWVIYQSTVPLPRERAWVKSLPFRVRRIAATTPASSS